MSQLAQQALDRVDQLDQAVVGMLSALLGTDQNASGSRGSAHAFAQAAGQLETLLIQMRQQPPGGSQEQQLHQAVQALESESLRKDQLLRVAQTKLEEWQRTCRELQDVHQRNLFRFNLPQS